MGQSYQKPETEQFLPRTLASLTTDMNVHVQTGWWPLRVSPPISLSPISVSLLQGSSSCPYTDIHVRGETCQCPWQKLLCVWFLVRLLNIYFGRGKILILRKCPPQAFMVVTPAMSVLLVTNSPSFSWGPPSTPSRTTGGPRNHCLKTIELSIIHNKDTDDYRSHQLCTCDKC